ncbi:hypothetical protein [Xanthovirga aplysinae]|uniref:hypothetical protein n=1 Tax=Xanthovirga aplysinae TaxID=2529853 RepID=UPI0012BB73DE|nr:hypothetical protein [Xanthovirga aplysinae]MTI32684.1 hypothetical protein [Xanthovirga aplysinae]
MNSLKKSVLFFSLLLAQFSGCKTKYLEPDDLKIGYHYYPFQVGNYWTYSVDSIFYYSEHDSVVSEYQVKQKVESFFVEGENDTTFLLYRYRRNVQNEWQQDSIWTARKRNNQLIITEKNIPYVKMVFPVEVGKSWDGNAFSGKENYSYSISNLRSEFSSEELEFSNCMEVVEKFDDQGEEEFIYEKEIYAPHVGLVYRYSSILPHEEGGSYKNSGGIVGLHYIQTLIEYGKE